MLEGAAAFVPGGRDDDEVEVWNGLVVPDGWKGLPPLPEEPPLNPPKKDPLILYDHDKWTNNPLINGKKHAISRESDGIGVGFL